MRHTFTLANGVEIPAVGFGTYKAADNTDEAIISEAIRRGIAILIRQPFISMKKQ